VQFDSDLQARLQTNGGSRLRNNFRKAEFHDALNEIILEVRGALRNWKPVRSGIVGKLEFKL
jgi:hypothetical protein